MSTTPFRNVTYPEESVPTYRCPCCGYKTLNGRGQEEICPVCFWHDDGQDDHDADEVRGGPNYELSLSEARRNFREFRASSVRVREHVREPKPEEV
jgi:hypothetical protein